MITRIEGYKHCNAPIGAIVRTVRMPHIHDKLHLRRRERVVFWKLEFRGEDAAFEGCAFGPLNEGFPQEHVVFVDGAGGDAFGWVRGEGLVFFEEAFGS